MRENSIVRCGNNKRNEVVGTRQTTSVVAISLVIFIGISKSYYGDGKRKAIKYFGSVGFKCTG